MIKKQVNLRLNPATVKMLDELQQLMINNGFSVSKADVVEDAIHQMYKSSSLNEKLIE